jgi:histidine triad (HIT) family protein
MLRKEIPSHIVYEDGHSLAFLDINPRSPGHTVIIPKFHAPTLADLPEEEVGPLFLSVRKMAMLLKDKLSADGLTFGINQGEVSGQTVQHLHVHIMPRFEGDGGGSIHSVVDNPPELSLQEMVEKLLSH